MKRGEPNFDLEVTYYHYFNENVGERYFKVKENEPVLQIVAGTQKKKGRPYQMGVNYMNYNTFIGSWGWKKSESKFIKTISKDKFEKVLEKMIKKFKK